MVKKLLAIEGRKTLFYPTFRTIIGLHALLFLIVALVASNINLNIEGIRIDKVFQFPHLWNTLAWIASWFNLLLGILAIMLTCNEFQFRTFRKQLIDGLTRNELIIAKLFVITSLAAYAMILVFVSGLLFGITKSSTFTAADFVHGLQYLPVLFIQSLGYMLLGLLIAFIFRNTAFSIIAYLLYFFPVEPIVRAFMSDSAAAFMPVKTIANLTPMPDFVGISLSDVIQISNGTGSLEMIGTASQSTPLLTTSIVTIGYCLIFGIIVKVIAVNKNF